MHSCTALLATGLFNIQLMRVSINQTHHIGTSVVWNGRINAQLATLSKGEGSPGLFVAAIMNTCLLASRPSISVSSWFTTRALALV